MNKFKNVLVITPIITFSSFLEGMKTGNRYRDLKFQEKSGPQLMPSSPFVASYSSNNTHILNAVKM
jgi:hypothetical protein